MELQELCRRWWYALQRALRYRRAETDHATARVLLLARIGVIGNPLCYLVWHRLWPVEFESIALRVVAVLLCVAGLFARRFNRRWLGVYLLIALSYILPFFFTVMCVMNHSTAIWTESLLI